MSNIDLVVSGTENAVTMVEASGKEVPEEEMVDAIMFRTCIYQRNCTTQRELLSKCGKEKQPTPPLKIDMVLLEEIKRNIILIY